MLNERILCPRLAANAAIPNAIGAVPVMVMPVVDRGGTCRALCEAQGIEFRPLLTALDLGFTYEGP